MELVETGFEGLFEIIPRVFEDDRGYFLETFREEFLESHNITTKFIQDNQSYSTPGVIRGLHLQSAPHGQVKLVRVAKGRVLDVVVDLRKGSRTFGQHYRCLLDSARCNMLYIPEGFGHGIAVLEESIFVYKCSGYYHGPSETGVIYNDPDLNIDWGIDNPVVSTKDLELPGFQEYCEKYIN